MKKLLSLFILTLLPLIASADPIEINGIYYNLVTKAKIAEVVNPKGEYNPSVYTGKIVIPESVDYLGTTYSVTSIGSWAFYACSDLVSVVIGNNVISIGFQGFALCRNLTSVTIGNSVTSIGRYAFSNCSGLVSVTIPNSVTSIDDCAFLNCISLTSMTVPNSVTSIGGWVFEGCSGLTSVIIPNSITTIKTGLFYGCSNLTSFTIPNSVTLILGDAFSGCDGLTSIIIPNNVISIYENAFSNCKDLTDVFCYAEKVPSTESNAFEGSYIEYATLHVHESSINAYSSIEPWRNYKEIVPLPQLIYKVDGEIYKTVVPMIGEAIVSEPEPTKEGYTFSGWSEIPETMPDHDVEVTGTFSINSYTITYKIDGEVFKTESVEYGSAITSPEAPAREGYTFEWIDVPETMPAHDVTITGTFTVNKYKLTYMVDGEEYKTSEVDYGAAIIAEAEPTKEGYTFSGWSEIPETMPAHDVIVTGTFIVNKYKLTYMVDGEEYKTSEVEYGTTITAEEEPTKEGYTFSGWSEIPETMPGHDVEVTGTFTINSYTITYKIEGEVFKTESVEYGSAITPPEAPAREGYTFEWMDIPETMPAKDITIEGSYTSGIGVVYTEEGGDVKWYTIDGKQKETPQKGINIMKTSNGKTRKMLMK